MKSQRQEFSLITKQRKKVKKVKREVPLLRFANSKALALIAIGSHVWLFAPPAAEATRAHLTGARFNSAAFCSGHLAKY